MNWGIVFAVTVMVASVGFVAVRLRRGKGQSLSTVLAGLSALNLGAALLVVSTPGDGILKNITIAVFLLGALGCYIGEHRVARMSSQDRLER